MHKILVVDICVVVVAANAAFCISFWLCMKRLQVPLETLEIAGMLINFHSSKFGYSYVLFLAKVMPKFLVNFGMTLAKNMTYFL